ncbi:hypothetical protein H9P43_002635 [Blastocladiella emersonii ATCC 22665]|nr:hypothetical protein H9P43_002635 [Blastocladiella emersonii ATCC 22665]
MGNCQNYMNLNIAMLVKGAIVLALSPLSILIILRKNRDELDEATLWLKAWNTINYLCGSTEIVVVILAIVALRSADHCLGAPALRQLTLGWVILYSVAMALPLARLVIVFVFLPAVIIISLRMGSRTRRARPQANAVDTVKFTADLLNKLIARKFVSGTANDTRSGPNEHVELAIAPEDATCAICIDEYQPGDDLVLLPCKHVYHNACLREWLAVSKLCPMCKADIVTGITGDGPSVEAAVTAGARAASA